jgi:hypothetical protein
MPNENEKPIREDTEMNVRILREKHRHHSRFGYYVAITAAVMRYADTSTIRVLLGNASMLWVYGLMKVYIFGGQHVFEREAYYYMAQLAPDWAWAIAFLFHGLGVYWRIYDSKSRSTWALLINGAGFLIWFVSTLSINVAIGQFLPSSSLEWTLVFASGWALYRTGFSHEANLFKQ